MKFCMCFLLVLLMFLVLGAQEGQIQKITIPSPSIDSEMPLSIYTPPGYSFSREQPYRLYIYLHGAVGSVEWTYAEWLKPIYDYLINTGQIDPIVVVFPVLKFKHVHGKEIPYDLHFYMDSERNGNYESAITKDLLEWLPMWYNVAVNREERAIGGFSMGGDGSLRIAIRNSDLFVACVSHDGNPDLRAQLLYRPFLLEETSGPPFDYAIEKGFWSADWFGFASAFAPNMTNPNMPEWFFDFPLDSLGNTIDSIFYDQIIANHDPATMMKNPDIFKKNVAIFVESSADGRVENAMFHNELVSMGVPHVYHQVDGGHGIHEETVLASMKFIDKTMDEAIAQKDVQRDVCMRAPFDRITQLNTYSNGDYIPRATVKNMGTQSLSQVELKCEILHDGQSVYAENLSVNTLAAQSVEQVQFPSWKPEEEAVYDVKMYSTLNTDQYKMNDTLKTMITISSLVDDFESGLTKWTGNNDWEIINKDSLGAEYCVGHTPYFDYDNNCNSWLILKDSFDFSKLKSAELQFDTRYLFADKGDFGVVNISLDHGTTWIPIGDTLRGQDDQWAPIHVSFGDFSGPGFDNVLLGFQMVTNASGTSTGWFLDDISLNVEEYPVFAETKEMRITDFALGQNYPNPFNPSTTIQFSLPYESLVTIDVYNLLGEKVERLVEKKYQAGLYNIEWNANDYASGLYFCRMSADGFEQVRKLLLQK